MRTNVPILPHFKDCLSKIAEPTFFLFFHFYDVHGPYPVRKNFSELYRNIGYIDELNARVEHIWTKENSQPISYEPLSIQNKIDLGILKKIGSLSKKNSKQNFPQL